MNSDKYKDSISPVKMEIMNLCSALTAIEQWGFFSVLWHGASVNNGHLWGPVTITPIAERLAVEAVITYFYELDLSWLGFKHPTGGERCKNRPRHRHGSFSFEIQL